MKLLTLCFSVLCVCSYVQSDILIQPLYDDLTTKSITYNVSKPLFIKCNVTSDDPKDLEGIKLIWKKDSKPVTEIEKLKKRIKDVPVRGTLHNLMIDPSEEEDVGNYTCGVNMSEENIAVYSRPVVLVPISQNVVEGEKLRLECTVWGQPYAKIHWTYSNETLNETVIVPDERTTFGPDKVKNIENATLVIKDFNMWDRGVYKCVGRTTTNKLISDKCMVRVKGRYAALWPFLGICAEVFVLCAIIFIYEKKRNKTELEESDTDQSPDQKNTPDHNKDSNLRHRQ